MRVSVHRCGGPDERRLHAGFLALMPRIETHARITFRGSACPARRDELVAETLGLAWAWYRRLADRGKDAAAFPATFAALAARAVRSGRRVAGPERAREVLSPVAQRRHGFRVEPLSTARHPRPGRSSAAPPRAAGQDALEERLRDNARTPVPDQVQFRIDWPRFFRGLSARDRRLATFLSLGHPGTAAAAKFRLSPSRVTQLRRKWYRAWRSFQDEGPGGGRPASPHGGAGRGERSSALAASGPGGGSRDTEVTSAPQGSIT